MHLLLDKILKRWGIEGIDKMSEEEKATLNKWEGNFAVLTGEITVEKIKEFCIQQKAKLEKEFGNLDSTDKKDFLLKAAMHVYSNIIKMIDAPEVERRSLEKYLDSLTK